jgi:hypothetical protein
MRKSKAGLSLLTITNEMEILTKSKLVCHRLKYSSYTHALKHELTYCELIEEFNCDAAEIAGPSYHNILLGIWTFENRATSPAGEILKKEDVQSRQSSAQSQ